MLRWDNCASCSSQQLSAGTGALKAARQVPWDVCSQKSPTALQPSAVDGQGCVYINGTETPGASISSPSQHFNFLVLFLCEEASSSWDFNAQWQLCSARHRHIWQPWIYWICRHVPPVTSQVAIIVGVIGLIAWPLCMIHILTHTHAYMFVCVCFKSHLDKLVANFSSLRPGWLFSPRRTLFTVSSLQHTWFSDQIVSGCSLSFLTNKLLHSAGKKRESESIVITLESGQLSSTRGFTNCRKAAASAASLMMSVAASLRRSVTRRRKDLVSADKEVGEILERRSSSLPFPSLPSSPPPSLPLLEGIHLSLISSCGPIAHCSKLFTLPCHDKD